MWYIVWLWCWQRNMVELFSFSLQLSSSADQETSAEHYSILLKWPRQVLYFLTPMWDFLGQARQCKRIRSCNPATATMVERAGLYISLTLSNELWRWKCHRAIHYVSRWLAQIVEICFSAYTCASMWRTLKSSLMHDPNGQARFLGALAAAAASYHHVLLFPVQLVSQRLLIARWSILDTCHNVNVETPEFQIMQNNLVSASSLLLMLLLPRCCNNVIRITCHSIRHRFFPRSHVRQGHLWFILSAFNCIHTRPDMPDFLKFFYIF